MEKNNKKQKPELITDSKISYDIKYGSVLSTKYIELGDKLILYGEFQSGKSILIELKKSKEWEEYILQNPSFENFVNRLETNELIKKIILRLGEKTNVIQLSKFLKRAPIYVRRRTFSMNWEMIDILKLIY